jgi:hypothetical protein
MGTKHHNTSNARKHVIRMKCQKNIHGLQMFNVWTFEWKSATAFMEVWALVFDVWIWWWFLWTASDTTHRRQVSACPAPGRRRRDGHLSFPPVLRRAWFWKQILGWGALEIRANITRRQWTLVVLRKSKVHSDLPKQCRQILIIANVSINLFIGKAYFKILNFNTEDP